MELSLRLVFPLCKLVGLQNYPTPLLPGEARREAREEQLLSQLHFSGALAAPVLWRFGGGGGVGGVWGVCAGGGGGGARARAGEGEGVGGGAQGGAGRDACA